MTFPYANVWYNITEPGTSLVSSSILYNNSGTTGSVYLNYTSSNVHSWQFYPIGGGSQYILRTQALGPNATMQTVSQGGEIVVQMQSGPITNASLWSMTTWGTGDGTYYFTNEAIGNGSYMDTNAPGGVGLVWMNSDTSISNLGQRWKIHSLSSITESAFSTAPPLASATSSSTAATATSSTATTATSTSTSSESYGTAPVGPSIGLKAGLGAGLGCAALLLIIALIYLFMRRKRGYSSVRLDSNLPQYSGHGQAGAKEMIVYAHRKSENEGAREMDNSNTRYEMYTGPHVVELEGNHGAEEKDDHATNKDMNNGVNKDDIQVVKPDRNHVWA